MAALGEFRPPNQINKDEDKYWKLTKIQIGYAIAGFLVGIAVLFLLSLTKNVFLIILGVDLMIWCVIIGVFIGGVEIDNSKYLQGGGLRMDRYIFRKIKKMRKKNQIIYTRNIDRDKPNIYRESEDGFIKTRLKSLLKILGGV